MLRCAVQRRAAGDDEVEAAFNALGSGPGIYFGCDAGIAGLHPLQATLLTKPALAIDVRVDAVRVRALDDLGNGLLRHRGLQPFLQASRARTGHAPVNALRTFLAAFDGCADALLVGALRFDAHRLAGHGPQAPNGKAEPDSLGVFFFATTLLRRDATGAWQHISIRIDADSQPLAASARPSGIGSGQADDGSISTSDDRTGDQHRDGSDRKGASSRTDRRPERDDFAPGGYAGIVARATARLAREPLVSLTLSQSFRRPLGGASPARAFERLRRANPAPATFFVAIDEGDCVFGASPDLQLVVEGTDVTALPVCGTVARGHGPVGEAESLRVLLNEEVDAASLAVCTDALRNDLAPLCEAGSLCLRDRRRPMALATVVHTVDRLSGRLREGADAWDAIVATAAPVMVTGTPRRLALAAIDELEASPRGWYGGLVVRVSASGDALVGTLLRAAAIRDGSVEVRTGGDLLADSDPEREELESRVKAVSLWRALGLPVDDDLRATVADAATPARSKLAAAGPATAALHDVGDAFPAGMADTLTGLGIALDPIGRVAATVVLIGSEAASCQAACDGSRSLVAIGDAACRVLQHRGFGLHAMRPSQGRSLRCTTTAAAPPGLPHRFTAASHASLAIDWQAQPSLASRPGWSAWLEDDAGEPLVLANEALRCVCMLIRPDSLLSDPAARDLLHAAIVWAGAGAAAGANAGGKQR